MKPVPFRYLLFLIVCCISIGCANVVPPSGGDKDVTPPKLLSISPADSLLNTRVTRIDMRFDEYVNVGNPGQEIVVSPLLPVPLSVISAGKKVTVNIPDSLLNDSTTYRISFGNAIKDLHEDNPFSGYNYTFSTGNYFDSLTLKGFVFDAATGLPDSGSRVVLYSAARSDSAIIREKPMYAANVGAGGEFVLAGLPARRFRIYALHDANNNLVYDGGEETVAFIDSIFIPADTVIEPVVLNVFKELPDAFSIPDSMLTDSMRAVKDSVIGNKGKQGGTVKRKNPSADKDGLLYNVAVDTADNRKRTLDITRPITIIFNKEPDTINSSRIFLTYDSTGIDVETPFTIQKDTAIVENVKLNSNWKENTLYTLRLLKGFAKDSAGVDVLPSRYTFRTRNDDDYAKLHIQLPGKYNGPAFLLMITTAEDTIYTKPVTDTLINLVRLQPGDYKLSIIADKNMNGKWDTGNLLEKLQPEEVIPYMAPVLLKAGWEYTVDFIKEEKQKPSYTPSLIKGGKPPMRK